MIDAAWFAENQTEIAAALDRVAEDFTKGRYEMDTSKLTYLKDWGDFKLYLDINSGNFMALDGAEASGDVLKTASTLSELTEKVGRYEKAKMVKKEKLSIPAVTLDLAAILVTGVHVGTGRVLTSPPTKDYRDVAGYYDCTRSRSLIQDYLRLKKEMEVIETELRLFQIPTKPGGYNSSIEERLEVLKSRAAEWVKLAAQEVL